MKYSCVYLADDITNSNLALVLSRTVIKNNSKLNKSVAGKVSYILKMINKKRNYTVSTFITTPLSIYV